MIVSRRKFLGGATSATATLLAPGTGAFEDFFPRAGRAPACVLVDLHTECALPESIEGYQVALAASGVHFVRAQPGALPRCRMVIVPAVGALDARVASRLSAWLEEGTCLLLESAAGFADSAGFSAQQAQLHSHFRLEVERPVDLWAGPWGPHWKGLGQRRVPYVDYLWPLQTKIRDFSRVVPLAAPAGEIIGWVDGLPVALKRRVNKGTLIFLGSPLGPALLAGEPEARRWFGKLWSSF